MSITCPKQAAALEAIAAMNLDADGVLAVLQALERKVSSCVAYNNAKGLTDNVMDVAVNELDDIICTVKEQIRLDAMAAPDDEEELPYMGSTLSYSERCGTLGSAW